ncbi:MAG: DUF1499 domain-containing protein [Desulfobacterales bacterium]|jgi:uncharacterized protein (DUF1499 family)
MMKNLFSKHLSLYVCILLSATPAAAGPSRISPCPDSPNCVSSQSNDSAHFIEPLRYTGNLADARQKLIELLENSKHTRLISAETDYIHAEFRSLIFNFVDDVEFYFSSEDRIIHVRSASRTGYYDFGVNRRRVERLRGTFENSAK